MHNNYIKKLKEIGEKLGFSTENIKTPLGVLDCIWRIKNLSLPNINEDLPLVAFEVICSENQKDIKGDLTNLVASKPSLAIFVLIRNEIKKHPRGGSTSEQWLKRIEKFVEKIREGCKGILRTEVWYEDDVDKLYSVTISKR